MPPTCPRPVFLHLGTFADQLFHALALLALSRPDAISDEDEPTARLWFWGTLLFSGSIYGLSVGGPVCASSLQLATCNSCGNPPPHCQSQYEP